MSAAETILSPEAVTGAHGSSLQRLVTPHFSVLDLLDGVARDIVRTLEEPRVYRWTTWDSFAGRQIYHERVMGEVEAVVEVLRRHNVQPSNDKDQAQNGRA